MPYDADREYSPNRDDAGWDAPSGPGSPGPSTSVMEPPPGAPRFALPYEDPFATSGRGPAGPTDGNPPARTSFGRRRTSALLALALLGAGATGGVAGALVERGNSSTTTVTVPSSVTRTSTAASGQAAVAGSPESAAAVIGPSVVTIAVTGTQSSTSRFGQSQNVSDTGSGVVLRSDGYILTNNHVVAAAESGGTVSVTFSNGKTVAAKIVGFDATSDLAVVKADNATGLTAAVFADSDALKVGQGVLAVGAPLGLSNTVTEGIVSTLHRPVATGEAGASAQSVIDAVQTDAAINPGNSGGALVDLAGHVVGINSAIASTGTTANGSTAGNIGVGFAIPSNAAARTADQLIATGKATHPQLGVSAADTASSADGTPGLGATINQVSGGAAAAGLQNGDVITKIDNRAVTDADSLIVAVRDHKPGDVVTVTYTRNGATATTKATLGTAGS